MGTWEFYLDESYNSHLFCVGGFFAPAGMWKEISAGWRARIAYENRKSEVRRFPPISRYHATDCANLKGEFDKKNGSFPVKSDSRRAFAESSARRDLAGSPLVDVSRMFGNILSPQATISGKASTTCVSG